MKLGLSVQPEDKVYTTVSARMEKPPASGISEALAKKIIDAARDPGLRTGAFGAQMGLIVDHALKDGKGAYLWLGEEQKAAVRGWIAGAVLEKYAHEESTRRNGQFIGYGPLGESIATDIASLGQKAVVECKVNAELLRLSAEYAAPIIEKLGESVASALNHAKNTKKTMEKPALGDDDKALLWVAQRKIKQRAEEAMEIIEAERKTAQLRYPNINLAGSEGQRYKSEILSGGTTDKYELLVLLMLKHHIGTCACVSLDLQNIASPNANEATRERSKGNYFAGLERLNNLNELLKSIRGNPENIGLILYQDFL